MQKIVVFGKYKFDLKSFLRNLEKEFLQYNSFLNKNGKILYKDSNQICFLTEKGETRVSIRVINHQKPTTCFRRKDEDMVFLRVRNITFQEYIKYIKPLTERAGIKGVLPEAKCFKLISEMYGDTEAVYYADKKDFLVKEIEQSLSQTSGGKFTSFDDAREALRTLIMQEINREQNNINIYTASIKASNDKISSLIAKL